MANTQQIPEHLLKSPFFSRLLEERTELESRLGRAKQGVDLWTPESKMRQKQMEFLRDEQIPGMEQYLKGLTLRIEDLIANEG